ncbi:hypothetical protein Vadar_026351 [Vaccinium darrowii]|uniref:Uncharacterized protein n=1 Tax=Vaccinium darrowii TaxID=229202 RepID=A0ACB7XCM5_9ERIC|nr:hypothetical protein Vadar_026351 [Vaccinium darrowii]
MVEESSTIVTSTPSSASSLILDQLLFHAIIASVSEHVTPFIASTTTSLEAWTKLIGLYANRSCSHIMSLKDLLSKPRDSNPVAECLMTIKTTSDELALIDVPILENNLGLYILNGIG